MGLREVHRLRSWEEISDHKPLIPLLNTKQLDNMPPRIMRFRLRLSRFDYTRPWQRSVQQILCLVRQWQETTRILAYRNFCGQCRTISPSNRATSEQVQTSTGARPCLPANCRVLPTWMARKSFSETRCHTILEVERLDKAKQTCFWFPPWSLFGTSKKKKEWFTLSPTTRPYLEEQEVQSLPITHHNTIFGRKRSCIYQQIKKI